MSCCRLLVCLQSHMWSLRLIDGASMSGIINSSLILTTFEVFVDVKLIPRPSTYLLTSLGTSVGTHLGTQGTTCREAVVYEVYDKVLPISLQNLDKSIQGPGGPSWAYQSFIEAPCDVTWAPPIHPSNNFNTGADRDHLQTSNLQLSIHFCLFKPPSTYHSLPSPTRL